MLEFIGAHDATCLYVLFVLQSCIAFFGFPLLLSACSSTEKRLNLSYGRWMAKWMFVCFVGKWMIETYDIVEIQYAKDMDPKYTPEDFNPYKLLHINDDGSFGTEQIEEAFARLSLKYDPKNSNPNIPEWKVLRRYRRLIRAYETLTNEQKFFNYQKFGDPNGAMTVRALRLALPTWVFDEDFRPFLITWTFITIVAAILGLRVM